MNADEEYTDTRLVVDFKIEDQKIMDLSLTGPAVAVFNGEFTI